MAVELTEEAQERVAERRSNAIAAYTEAARRNAKEQNRRMPDGATVIERQKRDDMAGFNLRRDGVAIEVLVNLDRYPPPKRWQINEGNLLMATILLCRAVHWGIEHGRRAKHITRDYKPPVLNLLDRKLNADTGELSIQFVFKGDPVDLRIRRVLVSGGQYYVPLGPDREDFRRIHRADLIAKIEESKEEALKRLKATKGGGLLCE